MSTQAVGGTGTAATPDLDRRPAALVLTAAIARRHYRDGRSKVEIADEFGLSRFKVARLLANAVETGLVRIEIDNPGSVDTELSDQLRVAFGLQHAIVVGVAERSVESLRQAVGQATAELLSELITADDVLGIAWARALGAMSESLVELAPCTIVQLTGASPLVHGNSVDLVRAVAKVAGGPVHAFYAPHTLPDAITASGLRGQPEVAAAIRRFDSLTKAVVAVGSWDPPYSTFHEVMDPRDRDSLTRAGVCAEISGIFVDETGQPVLTDVSDRIIGISHQQLRAVPEVIAAAYGSVKTRAVQAALRAGIVTSLVVNTALARSLLSAVDGE